MRLGPLRTRGDAWVPSECQPGKGVGYRPRSLSAASGIRLIDRRLFAMFVVPARRSTLITRFLM